jgi:hypothetical protein
MNKNRTLKTVALSTGARNVVLAGALATMIACAPAEPLRLLPPDASLRTIQSRTIEAPSEQAVLNASVALLQDLNYTVDRFDPQLGVISATGHQESQKLEVDTAKSAGLLFGDAACVILLGWPCGYYDDAHNTFPEDVRMTVLVAPVANTSNLYAVRFSMQSVLQPKDSWTISSDLNGFSEQPKLVVDQGRYQTLFEKLSKSMFLETSL